MKNHVNNLPDKTLVLTPHRLFSLWDMIPFLPLEFYQSKFHLEQIIRDFSNSTDDTITEHDRLAVLNSLKPIKKQCETCELQHTLDSIEHIESNWDFSENYYSPHALAALLEGMLAIMRKELQKRTFAFIPEINARYFERDDLFGEQFHKNTSPEINVEIKSAGNCLAADLNSAAVFHLIRAAERGMRRLASRLKVSVKRDGKTIKISGATWGELIIEIRKTIDSERKKSPADRKIKGRLRDFELLADQSEILADHLNLLKDDRNDVMHTHNDFKASEALSVFERVRDFMQKLAKIISLK
jgi:hypothetical protein